MKSIILKRVEERLRREVQLPQSDRTCSYNSQSKRLVGMMVLYSHFGEGYSSSLSLLGFFGGVCTTSRDSMS
jgi:hypothetical protein